MVVIGIVTKISIGDTYGRLTVIGRDSSKKRLHWLCECTCGNVVSATSYSLTSGHTQSCGCLRSERIGERNTKYSSKNNKIIDNKDGTISLFDEQNNMCIIDNDDYNILNRWYWRKAHDSRNKEGYWLTNAKKEDIANGYPTTIKLHQFVAELKYGKYDKESLVPDHLSRDHDDNRKCNIILKSKMDNSHNRSLSVTNKSGKTGVKYLEDRNKYQAYITVNYKNIHLGTFDSFEDAVKARKEAENKYEFKCDDEYPEYDEVAV